MNDPNSNPASSGDRSRDGARSDARPVGEEQLLDWIDGRLPASEMARLEASSGRQGLGDRVRQMQANRRAMRSMPLEKAPPELMGRVLQALERELVLGWQDGAQPQDGGTIAQELEPISFEEHRGTTPPWLPRLAMAAGVALLLAGGTYWAMLLTAPPATPGTLADAGTGGVEIAAKSNAEQGSEQLALASGNESNAGLATGDAGIASAAAPSGETLALSASAVAPASTQIASASEGFDLASQGRLVLRVLAGRTSYGQSRLASGLASSSTGWSLSRDVPAEVALAVLASRLVPDADPTLEGPALPPMMAASAEARRMLTPLMGPAAAFTTIASQQRTLAKLATVESTMILDIAATEEALEEARSDLARQLDAEVVLERVPQAIEIPASTDPARVLWWTKSPATWTPTLRIPVVVETKSIGDAAAQPASQPQQNDTPVAPR